MDDLRSRLEQLTPLQRATFTIKELRAKLDRYEREQRQPIAVIGLGCRFPRADNPESFWKLLIEGRDAIREVPRERWNVDAIYDPNSDLPGKVYTRCGGFLDGVFGFDAEFFHITPREAAAMDPQQRMLLEVSWEALEDAGIVPSKLSNTRAGVFVGVGSNDYAVMNIGDRAGVDPYLGTGNGASFASGRLSYLLGLQGTSISLDTACSSSLVAVHLACTSLRSGECDLVLAGGVQLMLAPDSTVFLCRTRALAPDGRCKTFDAAADGYGRGEGCGVVVLKRLCDAQHDGDQIHAVIRGSAVNHDGPSGGLTVPNGLAQRKLIRQALQNAGVSPNRIDYVETHGTGTSLGDPIELDALGSVLAEGRNKDRRVFVGSVKTNIGHLEAAAGVAGLIKVVLAVKHGLIPSHLNFVSPNTHIPWEQLPLSVAKELMHWPATKQARVAAVSAFGLSGTNAHMIVESAPPAHAEQTYTERGFTVLCLSAKTEPALRSIAERWVAILQAGSPLSASCASAYIRRSHFNHRLAIATGSRQDLIESLKCYLAGQVSPGSYTGQLARGTPKVVFSFGGRWRGRQDHYRALREVESFRVAVEQCATLAENHGEHSIQQCICDNSQADAVCVDLCIFTVQYATAALWRSWGINPDGVMGRGIGRYVSAVVAGALTLADAIKLIARRRLPTAAAGSDDRGSTGLQDVARLVGLATPHTPIFSDQSGSPLAQEHLNAAYVDRSSDDTSSPLSCWRGLTAEGVQCLVDMDVDRVAPPGERDRALLVLNSWADEPAGQPRHLVDCLAALYVCGVQFDWAGFDPPNCAARTVLPVYPFQHEHHITARAVEYQRLCGAASRPVDAQGFVAEGVTRKWGTNSLSREAVQAEVRRIVAKLIGYGPNRAIDSRSGFTDLGMDSMMMMDLRAELQASLGRTLPATLAFDFPCIEALSAHLASDEPSKPQREFALGHSEEPIAIVGMSCRLPGGANSPQAFWELLREGRRAISEVPRERWDVDAIFDLDPDAPGKAYTRRGGFLVGANIEGFDAEFFGISPREALSMDPQQRLLLETAWEALEAAGQPPLGLTGRRVGVFVGIASNDYGQRLSASADIDPYAGTGNAASVAAGRVAYVFGFQGPALSVDTSCSSSLVSIHLACQSLRERDADLALAGGVNLMLSPEATIYFCKLRALAADGHCKTFDASADGYGRGEGCALIVLKRLSDALAQNDNVLAVIRGSAVNHDGKSSGLTVPNGPSQQAVIRRALGRAGIEPRQVSFVEAHGTGTSLGDPIEMSSIAAVFAADRTAKSPLLVASSKTNLGHLEAAAGVAGVMKVVLSMKHGAIPAHAGFNQLNPHISLANGAIDIPRQLTEWRTDGGSRIAGVSSFGISGTNAHVIVEEGPAVQPTSPSQPGAQLLTISAKTVSALTATAGAYVKFIDEAEDTPLESICYTAAVRRSHLEHRLSLVGESRAELKLGLERFLSGETRSMPRVYAGDASGVRAHRLMFVFSGVGSHWAGMGCSLLRELPTFAAAMKDIDAAFAAEAGWSPQACLESADASVLLDSPEKGEPCIFSIQVALARALQHFGVNPDGVVGHSLGEVAAAHVAGALDLPAAVRLVALRSRLRHSTQGRATMVAVGLPPEQMAAIIQEDREVCLAVVNAPSSVVVAGSYAGVERLERQLQARNVFCRRVRTNVGSHSPEMDAIRLELEQGLQDLIPQACPRSFYSSVTGNKLDGSELNASYWGRNLRDLVLFRDVIEHALTDGYDTFVEISPHTLLCQSIEQVIEHHGQNAQVLPSLTRNGNERAACLATLGALHAIGYPVDLTRLYTEPRTPCLLPAMMWQKKRFWLEPVTRARDVTNTSGETGSNLLYEMHWREVDLDRGQVSQMQAGHWLIFEDGSGFGAALSDILARNGHSFTTVRFSEEWQQHSETSFCVRPDEIEHYARLINRLQGGAHSFRGIIHATLMERGTVLTVEGLREAQKRSVISVFRLTQALARMGGTARLYLVTRGAIAEGNAPVLVAGAPLWGLGRVIALEHPNTLGKLIDLDSTPDGQPITSDAQLVFNEISTLDEEDQIAFRGGRRHVARLTRASHPSAPNHTFHLAADGTYLVTGGLGALGLQVAAWLCRHGARHLALLGRRGLVAETELATLSETDPRRRAWHAVRELEASGVSVRIIEADVADAARMQEAMACLREFPRLRGVIHAAGTSVPTTLAEMDQNTFESVLHAKVEGAWNLHELTRDLPLDFMIFFSSLASVLGSAMLGPYAAANHFLDALAHLRAQSGLPATSINWGSWAGEGMTTDEARVYFEQMGLGMIESEPAFEILARLVRAGTVQKTVAEIDWSRYRPVFEARRRRHLLDEVHDIALEPAKLTQKASIIEQIEKAPPVRARAMLIEYLRGEVAQVLGLEASSLDADAGFFQLGMDSLMSVSLRNRVQKAVAHALPTTLAFEHPSVSKLSDFIIANVLVTTSSPAAPSDRPVVSTPRADLSIDLEEDQLMELLAAELNIPSEIGADGE